MKIVKSLLYTGYPVLMDNSSVEKDIFLPMIRITEMKHYFEEV
jgi:hypothetical protein